jgi:predicted TIM-barrel fold metal-dependent hydrolase
MPGGLVIDAHTHLAPRSPVFTEWAAKCAAENSYEGLLRAMDANGVERAVVMGHWVVEEGDRTAPFQNRTNNDLLHYIERGEGRLRGLLGVNLAPAGPVDLDLLDEHLAHPGIVGVKCFTGYETYHADDIRLEPVFELVERHRGVVMFHTGDTLLPSGHVTYAHPMPADEVAVRHPDLTIVLAHCGQHWMPDAGEVIGKNPNAWGDISGWMVGRTDLPPHVDFLMHQFQSLIYWGVGCDKLMFGSDWPLMAIGPYLEFVDRCAFLTDAERRMILGGNADRLYWGA